MAYELYPLHLFFNNCYVYFSYWKNQIWIFVERKTIFTSSYLSKKLNILLFHLFLILHVSVLILKFINLFYFIIFYTTTVSSCKLVSSYFFVNTGSNIHTLKNSLDFINKLNLFTTWYLFSISFLLKGHLFAFKECWKNFLNNSNILSLEFSLLI